MRSRTVAAYLAMLVLFCTAVSADSALTPIEDAMQAPAIDAPDLAGVDRSLAEFDGKVVVINFWATWCPPCVKELPSMQALWERFRARDFAMVAVNVGEDRQSVSDFLDDFDTRIDFTVLLDEELAVVKRWPVFGLPTSFVVDGEGNVVFKALGERDWSDEAIIAEIAAMLNGHDGHPTSSHADTVRP